MLKGDPREIVPRVAEEWRISHLCYEADFEPYSVARDHDITQALSQRGTGIQVVSRVSHTLVRTVA